MVRTVWFGLLVVLLAGVMPLAVVAQTEPDFDDDPYDQTTCAGVPEDEMESTRSGAVPNPGGPVDMNGNSSRNGGNDPDGYSPFPNGSFQLPFDDQSSGSNSNEFSFQPTYTDEEDQRVNGSFYDEPQISLQLATPTAVPGQDVVGTVQYDSFSSGDVPGSDFYTVVFVDGTFVNGYMAGGSAEALEELRSGGGAGRPDCGVVGRQPQSDQDGDGMDDGWEIRYGLNPNDPSDAGGDPDNDGFAVELKNLEGEVVNPAPPIAGAELGDGRFTSYEEYVLDTDPTKPDTDGDGFSDEQDAVGFGQTEVRFPARKEIGQGAYTVHLIVAGLTEKRNEDAERLVKIDSAFSQVQVGNREDLQVELAVVSGGAPGETLVVEANPGGTDQRDLLSTYRWSVNGELFTPGSGQSRRTLEYPIAPEVPTGTELNIALDVVNDETGQLARGRIAVVVGDTILLDYDPESVEIGGPVTVHALLTSTEDPAGLLFNWQLDRQPQLTASKLGAIQFEFTVSAAPGQSHQVELTVYRSHGSTLVGTAAATLKVLQPSVVLEITPTLPTTGATVLAHAEADHFGSTTLVYEFELDGAIVNATGSTLSFAAPAEGNHTLRVQVRSVAPQSESVSASVSFPVLPAAALSLSTGPTNLSASLMRTAGLGSVLGIVAVAGLVLRWTVLKPQAA